MILEIICADICFRFQGFSENLPLAIWNWKLDPWKISAFAQMPEDVPVVDVVCKQVFAVPQELMTLLCAEKDGFFEHRVLQMENGSTLWDFVRVAEKRCYLRYIVNSGWDTVTLLEDITNTNRMAAFEYLAHMLPGILLKQNMLTLHGVLMEYQGYGIVISAASGTGKTTHARLWRDMHHALIINGDRAVIGVKDGVWTGYGLPWSGTSGEQINRSVPLKALVILERGEQNEAYRITGLEGFGALLPHLEYPAWNRDMVNLAMSGVDHFLQEVPVVRFCCRPDFESVSILKETLENL